jgi:hypothetical protein
MGCEFAVRSSLQGTIGWLAFQVRGALLDLVTYPATKRLLVIGASDAVADPHMVKMDSKENVIPPIEAMVATPLGEQAHSISFPGQMPTRQLSQSRH